MKKFLKKLKSQKGLTGTDVIVASTIILVTIGLVSMLYVNVSLESRRITRTAGATRIATNMIENIDAMSYDDFVKELEGFSDIVNFEGEPFYKISDRTVYNTKIPSGYTVYLKAVNKYGNYEGDSSKKFDLVRDVEVRVIYSIGQTSETVELSTVKSRQLMSVCNDPSLETISRDIFPSIGNYSTVNKAFYPIKYVASAKGYIKTTADDPEWYDYTNKKWAVVLVSVRSESELFDANGKLKAPMSISEEMYTQKYTWIPKFFIDKDSYSAEGAKLVSFAYQSSNELKLSNNDLTSVDGTATFSYYTPVLKSDDEYNDVSLFRANDTGRWVGYAEGEITSTEISRFLYESDYGPCIFYD